MDDWGSFSADVCGRSERRYLKYRLQPLTGLSEPVSDKVGKQSGIGLLFNPGRRVSARISAHQRVSARIGAYRRMWPVFLFLP